jgi:hypothetical protein
MVCSIEQLYDEVTCKMQDSLFVLFVAMCNYILIEQSYRSGARAMQNRKDIDESALKGGKRLNLVQARLNDNERERLDGLRRRTGLSDSALVRAALIGLARRVETLEEDERLLVA